MIFARNTWEEKNHKKLTESVGIDKKRNASKKEKICFL